MPKAPYHQLISLLRRIPLYSYLHMCIVQNNYADKNTIDIAIFFLLSPCDGCGGVEMIKTLGCTIQCFFWRIWSSSKVFNLCFIWDVEGWWWMITGVVCICDGPLSTRHSFSAFEFIMKMTQHGGHILIKWLIIIHCYLPQFWWLCLTINGISNNLPFFQHLSTINISDPSQSVNCFCTKPFYRGTLY